MPALLQTLEGELAGIAFLCENGQRRLLMEPDRIPPETGLRFPDSVITVPNEVLLSFAAGPRLPRRFTANDRMHPPTNITSALMRELAISHLRGHGVEVGALAAPAPVPYGCKVNYADVLSYEEIKERFRGEPQHDLVSPSLRTTFESLEGVGDNSQDFIIASHVIEHTQDPIGAIARSYAALRHGGSLVLIVPDKRRTFDRDRDLTTLEHLIEDYRAPSRERDIPHFVEFSEKAGFGNDWRKLWEQQHPIHYHVWIYQTFMELIAWIKNNAAPFSSIWSHQTLPHETEDFEFYVVLTK